MADFSGVRPWMRGLATKIAASSVTLPAGELLVSDTGAVYGGNGSALSALKRLVRVDEVTTAVQNAITVTVNTAISNLVGAAPAALDTLVEIATQLQSDESAAAALTTTVAAKLPKPSGQTPGNFAVVGSDGASLTYITPPSTAGFDGGQVA